MKRRGYSKIELVVVLAIVAILAAVLVPMYRVRRDTRDCMVTMRQLGLGLRQYLNDADERYPLIKTAGGWAGNNGVVFLSWTKAYHMFHCPREGNPALGRESEDYLKYRTEPGFTDFWFNANLAGKKESDILFPDRTLMLGEGNDGVDVTDGRYSKTSLPPSWLTDTSKPSFRHSGGAHYVFADGHVAWLEPHQLTTKPAANSTYTFAVK